MSGLLWVCHEYTDFLDVHLWPEKEVWHKKKLN